MKTVLSVAFALILAAVTFGQNEQAPIVEKDVTYQNWKLKSVRDDSEMELRKLLGRNKLVAIVYYAPWCPNWRHDAPILMRLYDKYRANGFEIIGVSEYDSLEKAKANLDTLKVTFPVVNESLALTDREKTKHFEYRRSTGDARKWGSPWYIFIEPAKMEKKGDTLLKRANVINGEMIEAEGEKFIREKLGLPALTEKSSTAKAGEVEVCDPKETKSAELKKP